MYALTAELQAGSITAEQATRTALARAHAAQLPLNAFLSLQDARALQRAAQVDEARAAGTRPRALAGVPIAVKDNLCTSFAPTTCGSQMLRGFEARYDAHVVTELERAGAIIVGKTNLDEFGMGSTGEHSRTGPVPNPWDVSRAAGGSSSGSAAAVSAGCVPAALGSDTGGSVRQPASWCGICGLRPTYGRVSRFGLVAFASSCDQVGVLARSARDLATVLQVVAGPDARDATSLDEAVPDYAEALDASVAGLRIGIAPQFFPPGVDDDVRQRVEGAIDVLVDAGARRVSVELPHLAYSIACYYVIASAEASSNLARYTGVHFGRRCADADAADLETLWRRSRAEGLGLEVKRRIMLGTFALARGYHDAYYGQASAVRGLITAEFERAFAHVDLLATPTTPTTAATLGTLLDDPWQMYLSDVFTVPASLAGLAALSVPCGRDRRGLPVGLQLIGPRLGEPALLAAAHAFQQLTDYHEWAPEGARPRWLATA